MSAILLFCAFAVVAWILFRLAAPTETYEDKRAQTRREKVAAITADAQAKLYSPTKWIDKTKGTVQLPIDTAMDLVINDYQQKPVAPSQVKVETPYPLGLQLGAAPAPPGLANLPIGASPKPAPAAKISPPAAASPTPEVKP
jgi:hypothetical protein